METFNHILDGNFKTTGVKINGQTISLESLVDLYVSQQKTHLPLNKIVTHASSHNHLRSGGYNVNVTFADGHKEKYVFHQPDNMFFVADSFGVKVSSDIVNQLFKYNLN